ncbi:MAG: hypothetical protein ACXVAX_07715 [Pseudobdellovibrio sp.]
MKYSIFVLILTAIQLSFADNVEVFRFQRCYAQFTRTKIQSDNAILLKVKNKELSGTQACMNLLESSQLGDNGKVKNMTPESLQILKTFQSFHHSWFPSYDLNVLTGDFADGDFYDVNEMGYHVTYSLFKKDYNFSNIVTSPDSFQAIRRTDKPPILLYDDSLGVPKDRTNRWDIGSGPQKWDAAYVQFGQLIGLEKIPPSPVNVKFKDEDGETREVDLKKSLGAGVLGSIPYLLLNSGQIKSKMDGQMLDHRRWSKAVLNDLFCRSVPVIKPEDAEPFVDKMSSVAFKRSAQCMQCHATMDNMAGVLRNAQLFHTTYQNENSSLRGVYSNHVKGSGAYYEQKPTGRILYRNSKNELVDAKVDSLADFGQWITTQDDFYICAAQRYTSFLTGEKPEVLRDFITEQALQLKKHQKLSRLIENIISSDFYLKRRHSSL